MWNDIQFANSMVTCVLQVIIMCRCQLAQTSLNKTSFAEIGRDKSCNINKTVVGRVGIVQAANWFSDIYSLKKYMNEKGIDPAP